MRTQTADDFSLGLAFGGALIYVVPGAFVLAHKAESDHVQGSVGRGRIVGELREGALTRLSGRDEAAEGLLCIHFCVPCGG